MSDRDSFFVDRQNAAEAIKKLSEDDLVFLNHLIIERFNLIAQAKSTYLMADFHTGDKVSFCGRDGQRHTGIILKLNKITATIKLADGHLWKVAPSLLEKARTNP